MNSKSKKITRLMVTVIIAISMFFADMAGNNYDAKATYSYNVEAAMAYAEAHWNDGKGLCAEFVAKCVQAGGISIPTYTITIDVFNAVSNATGLQGQWLTLDSNGFATKSANGNILSRGDIVISWCDSYANGTSHSPYRPHIMICGGYDSAGYATFYAHNSARHNERICANAGKCETCGRRNKGKAKVLHISGGQQTTTTQVNNSNPGAPYPIPTRNLYNGTSGNDVRWVQKFLNDVRGAGLSIDGVCGSRTQNAVRSFQRDYGLTVDGIAGSATINKMLEVWRNKVSLPAGCVDFVTAVAPQTLRIQGWAFDRDDTNTFLDIHVYIGGPAGTKGAECIPIKANTSRPDVDAYYKVGNNHGFLSEIKTSKTGRQEVYLYAINIGSGNENPCIGHTTVNIEKEVTLDSISVSHAPAKTEYVKGESFDSSGMVVNAKYRDGTSKEIKDYTISGFENAGENTKITISYGGKTTSLYVKIHVPKNEWEVVTESTCTTHGIKALKCANCSRILDSESLELADHCWNNGVMTKEATATADGIKTYTCINCGETKTEIIRATGYTETTTEAPADTKPEAATEAPIATTETVETTEAPESSHGDDTSKTDTNSGGSSSSDGKDHSYIKAECQMPYWGEGGGYLIGFETFSNPGQSYRYEMLILDCTLLSQGQPAWIYTTGQCGVSDGNAFWTIWQPQYGYYWTLFRVYDKDGNLLDEACYGFVNVY